MSYETTFRQMYRSVSLIDKPRLNSGGKIIMPPSALHCLMSLLIDYPMLFELRNATTGRISHCGVLEFTAEEGMICMPSWMMENMHLEEGGLVQVKSTALPKGKYVKLQPHTKDFLDIMNPKAVLEKTLRNFSCLTSGDSILIDYNNKKYYINIVETKPSNAVSVVETDCEVDFAPPLDYKEPEKLAPTQVQEAAPVVAEPKFRPFTGSGRRLNGKPSNQQPPTVSSVGTNGRGPVAASDGRGNSSAVNSRSIGAGQSQGKLVFGANARQAPKEAETAKQQLTEKKDEPKFQAFTGKKYSLTG